MLPVALIHSGARRTEAHAWAARLGVLAEAAVTCLEAAPGETVLDWWEDGLDAAAIVLLLDEHVTPAPPTRDRWAPILDHIESGAAPPIAPVLAAPCPYPKLLERPPFFHANEPHKLVTWLHRHHADWPAPAFAPAHLPRFSATGIEDVWETLWQSLVDNADALALRGPAGAGKTTLAHALADKAAPLFRATIWVPCGDRPPDTIRATLARQLGGHDAAAHRLLIVFDDVHGHPPLTLPAGARASLLWTTRDPGAGITLAPRPAAALPAPPEPLRDALALLSCCDRNAAPAALLAPGQVQALVDGGWADPHDHERRAVRVVHPIEPAPPLIHARAVHQALAGFRDHPDAAFCALPEAARAFEAAALEDYPLAAALGERAARCCLLLERLPEAARFLRRLSEVADLHGDAPTADAARTSLRWITNGDGTLSPPPDPGEQLSLF